MGLTDYIEDDKAAKPIIDWLMYRSYEAQRRLYGISAQALKRSQIFEQADAYEEIYQNYLRRELASKRFI